MASRMIHYAIAQRAAQAYPIRRFDRFLLGQLLPDAYARNQGTADSHLKISLCGGSKKTYELERFRTRFSRQLQTDDLYRGYYLHLVQDLYFRDFVYNIHQWDPRIPGNIRRLHKDYSLANAYVIERYQLQAQLMIPGDLSGEALCSLYPFDTDQLQLDFAGDFAPVEKEAPFFFTSEMADAFI